MKKLGLGLNLVVASSIIVSLNAKEYMIFPGISELNNLRSLKSIPTINGIFYYDTNSDYLSKKLHSNMLLLQVVRDLSMKKNELTTQDLKDLEEMKNKFDKWINAVDLSNKIANLIVNANMLDIKGLTFTIYDFIIGEKIKELSICKKYPTIAYAVENFIKGIIEYTLDKYEVNTSLTSKSLSKMIGKEVVKNLTNKIGIILGVYEAGINTLKLSNNLAGIINVNKIQKEQIKNTMISSFIYDYILKYHNNLEEMYKKYVYGNINAYKNCEPNQLKNFWTVWLYYQKRENNEKEWFSSLYLDALSIEEQYEVALETWKLLAEYDANFFKKYSFTLKENIDKYIDSNGVVRYEKIYIPSVNYYKRDYFNGNFSKLYLMPLKIKDYSSSIKKGCLDKEFTPIINFNANTKENIKVLDKKIDGSDRNVKVVKVDYGRVRYKTYYGSEDGSIEFKMKPFYIPAFYSDVPNDYWAMPQISELFNKNIMQGYKNRDFGTKNNVTVGEFLAVFTRVFYKDELSRARNYKSLKFPLNYGTYLKEVKNIDTDLNEINQPAKRGYIAKILAKYLNDKLSYNQLDGDWDSYSDYLNKKCIVNGKKDLLNEGYMKFAPNDNITRDEFAVMIYNTLKVKKGEKLSCSKRKIKASYKFALPCQNCRYSGPYNRGWHGGKNGNHLAKDYPAFVGDNVISIADGKVEHIYKSIGGFGGFYDKTKQCYNKNSHSTNGPAIVVKYKKDNGQFFYALYGHVQAVDTLQEGDYVRKGETLGTVQHYYVLGWNNKEKVKCEYDDWPHLHFGIWDYATDFPNTQLGYGEDRHFVNPENFLQNNKYIKYLKD
jgi:murein DD-endopeptidase MepM/ murein hydrolase activator NlpD